MRRLSWCISVVAAQFALEMCTQPEIGKKITKTPILGVQSHSRSSTLVPLETLSAVLVMIYSQSLSICNCSHAR